MAVPSKALELLNGIKDRIVKAANEQNRQLSQDFKSVDDFKKFVFACAFRALRDNGLTTEQAWDFLTGEGEYKKMLDDCWNSHNPTSAITATIRVDEDSDPYEVADELGAVIGRENIEVCSYGSYYLLEVFVSGTEDEVTAAEVTIDGMEDTNNGTGHKVSYAG